MASYASATIVNEATIERDQREIVVNALRSAKEKTYTDLKKQFGLVDDEKPTTPADLVKRIQDGLYTIDKDDVDRVTYEPSYYIRWRDPSKVEDKAGYEAARVKLAEAYADAKLKAALLPVADLLKLVEDFKAFTA